MDGRLHRHPLPLGDPVGRIWSAWFGWRPRQVLRSRTPPGVPPERSGVPDSPDLSGSHRSRQETDPPGLTFAPHTLLTLAAARGSGQDQPLRLISSSQLTTGAEKSQ